MGAKRGIDLGVIQLQPSEFMTIALVLALARYFHSLPRENVGRIPYIIPPVLLIVIPAVLVLKQPALGTALLLLVSGAALCFLGGGRRRASAAPRPARPAAAPFRPRLMRAFPKTRLFHSF